MSGLSSLERAPQADLRALLELALVPLNEGLRRAARLYRQSIVRLAPCPQRLEALCSMPNRTTRRFHLIVATPDLGKTLVIDTAAGWLLPWLDDDPRTELPKQIDTILRPLISDWDIVHEAPLPDSASVPDVVQGYCVAAADGPVQSTHVRFVANSDLEARPSVLALQRQAWVLGCERLRAPVADFDSHAQVSAAMAWVDHQVATRSHGRVLSIARHRCSRHEYVARIESTSGKMYFKGGVERVADEGVLTHLLHGIDGRVVPETLALDVNSGRWIYRELPGILLSESKLTLGVAVEVVSVLAKLQLRAMDAPAVRNHLADRSLTATDLFEIVDRIVGSVFAHELDVFQKPDELSGLFSDWGSTRDAMFQRCLAVDRLKLPQCLVFSDLWPQNILATADGVGFIDLERCYWSCPVLPLWRYSCEVERTLQTGDRSRGRIEASFAAAWADVVSSKDMTSALAELPLLGRLFGLLLTSRELDLRERDLGAPLPMIHRASLLSRHMRRLLDGVVDHARGQWKSPRNPS
jgi:hypothetical protein